MSFIACGCFALLGCGKEPAPVQLEMLPVPPKVEIKPLVPLAPSRRTHISVDSRGNLYFLQETDAGQDVLFDVAQVSNVSRQLDLTSARVMELLKMPGGSGNIQSLAMGQSDWLCFYFAGGRGKDNAAALGYFDTRSGRITLLATTNVLASASGLGDSLELARGSVIQGPGTQMWLWLRHTDGAALLQFDPFASPSAGPVLKRPFATVLGPKDPIKIRSEREDLSEGMNGSLYYIDRKPAILWQIDPEGNAKMALSLNGAPSALTTPTIDGRGRVYMLAGDSDALSSHDFDADIDPAFSVNQPSLLTLEAGKLTALAREEFKAPDTVNLQTLQPRQLMPFRQEQTWVTYDFASGQLLQVRISRQ